MVIFTVWDPVVYSMGILSYPILCWRENIPDNNDVWTLCQAENADYLRSVDSRLKVQDGRPGDFTLCSFHIIYRAVVRLVGLEIFLMLRWKRIPIPDMSVVFLLQQYTVSCWLKSGRQWVPDWVDLHRKLNFTKGMLTCLTHCKAVEKLSCYWF